ncbi:MAG: TonB-dependent receptor [Melioribacter sp.]|uniref:TonB-dependent receptor n=1 Tax=Rosettibacter primus TaxID=3111523 RepID=UPI00247C35C5|nr:TonB-dependent receptor [Melioribacter sp.]
MRNIILLITCGLLISTKISSQNYGEIKGYVVEANTQLPLPLANVIILETNIGASTDLEGKFTIKNVPPNIYRIKASIIGYKSVIKTDIIVKPNSTTQVNFELAPETIELDNIIVQANYFDKNIIEPVSLRKLSNEELRRSPGGFEDVIRALSVLPGISQADAGRNDLIVRGGAPSENLYVVNGFEIPNINHFGTQGSTGGPISYINLDFVNEVNFSTGGFSVMYGDKISSTLNINLREGNDSRIKGKATISASMFGLNIEGPINKNSSFIVSARRSYLDFIFKAAGFSFVPEYYDLLTKVDYKIDNINTINFLFIGAFDKVKFFNDDKEKIINNSRILGSNQNQYIAGLSYRRVFSNGYMNLKYYRNFTDFDYVQKDSLLQPLFKNISREEENNFQLDVVHKFSKKIEMNFGAAIKLIEFNSDIYFPSFKTTFGEILPSLSLNEKNNFLKNGSYINFNFLLTPKILTNLGLRYDYFNGINKKNYISPRFSASYSLNEMFSFNFSAGIYRQLPSYIWLISNNQNKNLTAIKTNQYVFGINYLFRNDAELKIETFLKNYSNYPASLIRQYLVLANTGAGFSGSDDNFSSFGLDPLISAGEGNVKGLELSIQKKISDIPLYGILSLTYSKSDFIALDRIKRSSSYDQNWIFNIAGGYRFNMFWELSMKFRYASGRPYTPFDDNGLQNVNQYNSRRLKSFHSLDVRVDKRWLINSWTLITYIDIQNIYNRRNLSGIRWDQKTKTIDETTSIGILPSIGISLEF